MREWEALQLRKHHERERSLLHRRHLMQEYAVRHQREPGSLLESLLWRIAKNSPFGGMAIPLDQRAPPYLLRTYLTPQGRRLHLPRRLKELADMGTGGGARPYLHFFFRGDDDYEMHNHPWRISYSLILTGGYTEYRLNEETGLIETEVFRPGDINVIGHNDFHRVRLLDEERGCWTLFLSVDRLRPSDGRDWGFKHPDTGLYTPWGEFISKKEENRDEVLLGR